jgi:DNA-binding NarL/FixJ family response regulator
MIRKPVRIVIADPQAKVRSALRVLLEQHLGLVVSGEAATAEELLRQARAACPDLILLDWDLPGRDPADLLTTVRAQCPAVKVIVISSRAEVKAVALAAGASQFVNKGAAPEGLMAAVRACSAYGLRS